MKFEEKVTCLTAVSKPYDFAGNSGVSHHIRFNVNGEIFDCKSNEAQVVEFQKYVGKEGTAVFVFTSPKEKLSMTVESFEVDQ